MYDCDCDDCKLSKPQTIRLAVGQFKQHLKDAEKAFKKLHATGSYKPEDLIRVKEYKKLVDGTADIFNSAIADNDIPDEMLESLYNDVFVFSGIKTHAELLEASRMLLTDEGTIKPFKQFSQDIAALKKDYNEDYLEAEYQFALTSSQMAGKWAQVTNDYDLQYRTAFDDRVRESHKALHDITLPADDAFWLSYYPPNGWRCRCNAVQVRKGKYDISNAAAAVEAGEKATSQIGKDGKNRLEIFRFNPGKDKVVFPPAHPYRKVQGANKAERVLKAEILEKNNFTPAEIDGYERALNIKVNRGIFEYLSKETPLHSPVVKTGQSSRGAFYNPAGNSVTIPVDDRRRASKWWAEAVVYHEFGHAADWQNGFKKQAAVTELMEKHRSSYAKKKHAGYLDLDVRLKEYHLKALQSGDRDKLEKVMAVGDTVMSLNPKYGFGHTASYFKQAGNKEAEFLAHTFENKFAGNDVFKELMPDLYEDMISLADELKTKVK